MATAPDIQKSTNKHLIKPKELASRWACSRSSVDRIARRAGLTRYCLGEGRNGIIRYRIDEVEAYETSCAIPAQNSP